MTKQEALKIININGYGYPENEAAEAHRIIAHEMEFRMERAPEIIRGTSLFGEAVCPECGAVVYRIEKACSNCGQMLDWSEYEPEVKHARPDKSNAE